jgi:hypothetical protein
LTYYTFPFFIAGFKRPHLFHRVMKSTRMMHANEQFSGRLFFSGVVGRNAKLALKIKLPARF